MGIRVTFTTSVPPASMFYSNMMLFVYYIQLPVVSVGDTLSSQPWYFGNIGRTASEEKLARFRGTVSW